ncbi:MAG: hypothetical protein GW772_05870 [Flavobacteriia bacterium]|nr:hypothetical protein [Flavobacteriia bacterium]OIP45730.1 MAG: hypothetical protein AUK46_11470 [Flavobacteriaceae bacterium CG2_30_31_66]PIV97165.1 MAG: hypothetical protein COW43_04745 [Flavobacteriaceae bacterium CG17_big_fil_post_rev_8_21_14_2_50_31_13]PIX13612.1 MAG: hypothetical protein COZ74_05230 [Flavobacteriaceae bacterium CG_4_8_14_3_um_filter_31_8]PIY14884.1 MAG: hypothetical protein COZ16_07100 [Flavobacteriaceae bacterium CG_4_10_14_3_um_filter_31_253]PIZ09611.1 MAG: hypotheti
MKVLDQKRELIDWILALDDATMINTLYNLKNKSTLTFEERFAKGISVDSFKTEIKKRIQNYPNR